MTRKKPVSIKMNRKGEWFWQAKARNGEILAGPTGEGFKSKRSCKHNISVLKAILASVDVSKL